MLEPVDMLRRYWGFKEFRPLQGEIIENILQGKDTLALMPTGGGKSLCFQIPALCKPGLALVITPLISLMEDQVEQLNKRNIPALAVHAGMTGKEVEKKYKEALNGGYKLLYLSPERIQSRLFIDYLQDMAVNLITVDEAHCISQWGYDFRPAYLRIGELRWNLPGVPLLAITATATRKVRDDIQDKLAFRRNNVLVTSFFRKNLSYTVFPEDHKLQKTLDILSKVPGSSIVFCRSRQRTKEVAAWLSQSGLSAEYYHAGLDMEQRMRRQQAWMGNHTRVMVSTSAFGMGIDKPDVRSVIHYDIPESPETYYQQAGRAGRDGRRSYAVLLFNRRDLTRLKQSIALQFPPLDQIRGVYRALVSYLKIPAGGGEGLSYDFDLDKFTRVFGLDILLVSHVLRLLEQEEILLYQEIPFMPSRISFLVSKRDLYPFESEHPLLEPLIKCLLRNYEGIFDDYTAITESRIAYLLKKDVVTVVRQLKELKSFHILDYQPKKEKPQIYFPEQRLVVDRLQLDFKRINARKKVYTEGTNAMEAYAENSETCRSAMLLAYFDEKEAEPCGICDVCIRRRAP